MARVRCSLMVLEPLPKPVGQVRCLPARVSEVLGRAVQLAGRELAAERGFRKDVLNLLNQQHCHENRQNLSNRHQNHVANPVRDSHFY